MKYSDWFQVEERFFRFKVCDEYSFFGKYAFNQMFDPNKELNDDSFLDAFESYSPIFISANKGPMMFIANNFTQNIGTIGGVINI